jgi:hypothetical protein
LQVQGTLSAQAPNATWATQSNLALQYLKAYQERHRVAHQGKPGKTGRTFRGKGVQQPSRRGKGVQQPSRAQDQLDLVGRGRDPLSPPITRASFRSKMDAPAGTFFRQIRHPT